MNYERKTDLSQLIYDTRESQTTKDNCKFIPEGNYGENIKEHFVTDMEGDLLN